LGRKLIAMPRNLIPSDATIRAVKPGDQRSLLSDGDGLFLQLFVQGGSHGWRLDYRLDGRRRLMVAPLVLLRPGELRFAEWTEIDIDQALWTVPAARMERELRGKPLGAPHLVPLPRQAVEAFANCTPSPAAARWSSAASATTSAR
jgi:integrase